MTSHKPLAERMRPQHLDQYIGQEHLVGHGKALYQMLEHGQLYSIILWGPPGVGKTTLAQLIAQKTKLPFFTLSAIDSGVKEVRLVIEKARTLGKALLFIDEIHRFNKAQQDSLLGAVEKGILILIGATTENPSFEVIGALLSRCQVFILKPLQEEQLKQIVQQAIAQDSLLQNYNILVEEWEALIQLSGGDARKILNLLETLVSSSNSSQVCIRNAFVKDVLQKKMALYDKNGEQHYDIISAFIKSIRGSDPNAAVYWMARMLVAGEDPKFIARRMLILASEDIGNANPNALLLANTCFQAVQNIGYPECRIILSQTAIYLACAAKSNSAYMAIEKAYQLAQEDGDLAVPLHLRNAVTPLMKQMGYAKNYEYAHQYEGNFSPQEYLPDKKTGTLIYDPGKNASEDKMRAHLKQLWKDKYPY